jgi:hypothetical protein
MIMYFEEGLRPYSILDVTSSLQTRPPCNSGDRSFNSLPIEATSAVNNLEPQEPRILRKTG